MNIILIGFMASGKTTIGRALASRLGYHLLDTDEEIEKAAGLSVQEIFAQQGEAQFRLLEKQAIEALQGLDNCIIAVGGGAVMFYDNLTVLKRIGTTIFLNAPLPKILVNLQGKFRPLVGNTIDEAKMRELLERRYPTYQKADIVINTDGLDVEQTTAAIINQLGI